MGLKEKVDSIPIEVSSYVFIGLLAFTCFLYCCCKTRVQRRKNLRDFQNLKLKIEREQKLEEAKKLAEQENAKRLRR